MPIKVGTTNFKSPIAKALIGNDLIYTKKTETIEPFTSNPAPITWNYTNGYYEAEATNSYGTWKISGDNTNVTNTNYGIDKAFDDEYITYGYVYSVSPVSTGTPGNAILELPSGVLIAPTTIIVSHLKNTATANSSFVQGFNPDTNEWENLGALSNSSAERMNDTFTISSGTYYSKFRVRAYGRNTTMAFQLLMFQIKDGKIKY